MLTHTEIIDILTQISDGKARWKCLCELSENQSHRIMRFLRRLKRTKLPPAQTNQLFFETQADAFQTKEFAQMNEIQRASQQIINRSYQQKLEAPVAKIQSLQISGGQFIVHPGAKVKIDNRVSGCGNVTYK